MRLLQGWEVKSGATWENVGLHARQQLQDEAQKKTEMRPSSGRTKVTHNM